MSFLAGLGQAIQATMPIANMVLQHNMNQKQLGENQTNRDFQATMSNTTHQREVADLQAAGLNPILSAGGNGAPAPAGGTPSLVAPQINMPDFMAYGISLKQLEQADQRLALDKEANAANIAKSLSETELNKMKKILAQKGMVRAELEGEASTVLRNIIKWIKGSATSPSLKKIKPPTASPNVPGFEMEMP